MELVNGKSFNIIDGAGNAQVVLSESQVGPNSGVASLGSAVTSSSLTSVGTLVSLDVSGNSTLGSSTTANTLTVNGSIIQNNNSAETAYASKSLPAADSGFYIRNGDGTTGSYASLGLIASSTTAASDQSFSIVAQAQSSGLVPKVAFTQRSGNNSQNETMTLSPTNKVGINETDPDEFLHVTGVGAGIKVDSNGDSAVRWATSGTNKYSLYHNDGASALIFYDNTNNAERIRLESGGGTQLTRINVGGQESTGNIAGNTWWKVGTWAGVGVDAAARAT